MQQERSKTSKFILPERAMLFCFLGSKKQKRNGEIHHEGNHDSTIKAVAERGLSAD